MKMITKSALCLFTFVLTSLNALANEVDSDLFDAIKTARKEVFLHGNTVWNNIDTAPFGMLLTLPKREVLLCHPHIVDGFAQLPMDDLECLVQTRGSIFPSNLLAAMPVIEGRSTIVMGTPKATGKTRQNWVLTIVHEHFHQYQSVLPDYYQMVNSMDLDGGDNTGMWMLNYPLPYKDEAFNRLYDHAKEKLFLALTATDSSLRQKISEYLDARFNFTQYLSEKDRRYLEFQLWQEGVARWTEFALPLLSDNKDIQQAAQNLKLRTLHLLKNQSLRIHKRSALYEFGAAEAMLLELCLPDWKLRYSENLALEHLISEIVPVQCIVSKSA